MLKEQKIEVEVEGVESTKVKKKDPIDYTKFYVPPHKKKSIEVTNKNLKVIMKDSLNMVMMCQTQHGMYPAAYAIAHSQINDKKPLRFFVTHAGELIINPKIIKHTHHPINSFEGCMSYPDGPMVTIPRWNKCEIEYQTLDDNDKLTEILTKKLESRESKIYQHEIDHFDGIYIYDYIKG